MTSNPHNPVPGEQPQDPGPGSEPGRPAGGEQGQPPPPKPRGSKTRLVAAAGVLGLVAVAGIITGFAVSGNSNSGTSAAAQSPVPTASPAQHLPQRTAKPRATVSRGHLLATFTGVGARTSAPFRVTNPAFVHFGYRCASGSHSFSASMATTSGGNHQSIASTSGTGTSQATTVHPNATGSSYKISASSACPYFIRVYSSS